MKLIIFDSSTIINLAMNGLLDMLTKLKKGFNGKFIITSKVRYESVDRPLEIKKFELGALKVQKLIDEKVLEPPESIGIESEEIRKRSQEMLRVCNHIFIAQNEFIHIIDEGEASCLVLSLLASEKGIDNVIAIDERTTRMLGENPENLKKLLAQKLHMGVMIAKENNPKISKIKFVRSSELVYVAWKKGLIELKDGKVLDALLYATKFKGSAISYEEIEEIKKL